MSQAKTKSRAAPRYRVVRRNLPALSPAGSLVAPRKSVPPGRDYKKIIGAVFFAALVTLIFFSRTIYAHNLPVVTATAPERGTLSKTEHSSGIAGWSEVENLYASVGGVVEEVLVEEGDGVSEGQPLYRLRFDRSDAERKPKEIAQSRQKLYVEVQNINLSPDKQTRYLEDLKRETYELSTVSRYELNAVGIDIRRARDELNDARDRYDEGNATELEVDKANYALQALYLKQEELERKLAEEEESAQKALEGQEQNRESKIKDYEAEIAALNLQLQTRNIELQNLSLQEEPYKQALEDFDAHATVTSPVDGAVISLAAVKGETIREEQLIASVGVGGSFRLECGVSLDNNFVLPGDTVELTNSSRVVKGTVTAITPTAQNKLVTIALDSADTTAGETFDATFQKESETSYTLVPNGALNQDNDGYFLNLVKRRNGILGPEFYLERLTVYIGDSDAQNTAIVQGITFFEPIALISDKAVTEGDVVVLANEGDFFEQ